ncbi:hypothetical protein [uncultured Draconibacterium sp.]|uniref:hypothetical protein n=1 Tax=uncultured Draconibacterium sp. TaxID=1573823 RepID=UPI002AA604C2|nr:hypothetical protein [uncultured Draconibacterium sp.]
MKHILTFAILVFLFSCTEKKDVRIIEFENSLGETETKYLNDLVNDFDSFLNIKYKNEEFKFKEYLTEISESKEPDIWKIDKKKLEEIEKTNLFAKYDSIFPDSVWYDNKVFNVSYSDLNHGVTNSIAIIKEKNQNLNIDSIISSLKNKPRLEEIEPSYVQIALETVMTKDTLIQNYIDAKRTAGTISIRLIAGGLLHDLKPENEYFAKRIFMMEMND